jgi:hypothetical protein
LYAHLLHFTSGCIQLIPIQWNTSDAGEEAKVHQQKLRVVYLPAEGQTLEEEDEGQANMSSMLNTSEPVSMNSLQVEY